MAATIFAVVILVIGYFVAVGSKETRTTVTLLEPIRNSGPVFAAIAIAFNNDPEILGAATGIILVQIIVGIFIASHIGKGRPAPATVPETITWDRSCHYLEHYQVSTPKCNIASDP